MQEPSWHWNSSNLHNNFSGSGGRGVVSSSKILILIIKRLIKVHYFTHEPFCKKKNVNVTDTISWRDHHDRVVQLNWLHFCGMPLKVWPNTALGCNHQSICMPELQPLCSAALVPNVLPRRDEGLGKPCAVSVTLYYIGPTQDSNPDGRIQNHKQWPLHYHCTHYGHLSWEESQGSSRQTWVSMYPPQSPSSRSHYFLLLNFF